MNELREELERQFKAYGLIESDAQEQSDNDAETVENSNENSPIDQVEEINIAITVPQSYHDKFASEFKNLPAEWQAFLSAHEAETEKRLHDLINKQKIYQVLEEAYETSKARLQEAGIQKIQDWLEGLVWVDQKLAEKPLETLKALACVYGVDLKTPLPRPTNVSAEFINRLGQLESCYHKITSCLQNMQTQRLSDLVQMFGQQKDAEGKLLHPYFNDVKGLILSLLKSGMIPEITDAYEAALWLHPHIRHELINQEINSKTLEAQKAKKASFAPKGKSEAPERELTLREEIEKNMAAFMD